MNISQTLPQKDIGMDVMFFKIEKSNNFDSKNDWTELKLKRVVGRGERNRQK